MDAAGDPGSRRARLLEANLLVIMILVAAVGATDAGPEPLLVGLVINGREVATFEVLRQDARTLRRSGSPITLVLRVLRLDATKGGFTYPGCQSVLRVKAKTEPQQEI